MPAVGVLIDFEGGVDYAQDSLPSGTYIFTLVDENGCTLSDTLEIDEPEGLSCPIIPSQMWRAQETAMA